MNRNNFLETLKNRNPLDSVQVRELETILGNYPYFQTARALHLKGLYQNHSLVYNEALKKTAAYTTDRSVLFDYITSEEFLQHRISDRIKQRTAAEKEIEEREALQEAGLEMNFKEAERVFDPDLFESAERGDEYETISGIETSETEPDLPVNFDTKGRHTFSEWLKITKIQPVERLENEVKSKEKSKIIPSRQTREDKIIERFIQESPKIVPSQAPISQSYVVEFEPENRLMTETLAEIYVKQKNYDKAIQAYKILILKNPEKSGLFANRIREIELNRENKNK